MLASCLCKNPHHLLAWPILSISWAKCHFMFSTVHFCTATFSFIKILNIANPFRTYFDRLWFYVEFSICLSSVLRNHISSPHVCWPITNKQIKSATVISAILLWNKQITNEMYTRLKEITHDLSNAPFSVLPAQGVYWKWNDSKMAQRWPKGGPKMAQKKGEVILKTWNIYSQFIFYLLQGNYVSEKSSV